MDFEIRPSEDTRLVFPGDQVTLSCRVRTGADINDEHLRLEWLFRGVLLSEGPLASELTVNRTWDGDAWTATVFLPQVNSAHQGKWRCWAELFLRNNRGWKQKALRLIVMPIATLPRIATYDMSTTAGRLAIHFKLLFLFRTTTLGFS